MAKRKLTRRSHHRAQRQEAELHGMELRSLPPEQAKDTGRKKRTPLWKYLRLFAFLLLLAGGVELVVAALTAPQFRIADATVSGNEITPEEEVLHAQQSLIG